MLYLHPFQVHEALKLFIKQVFVWSFDAEQAVRFVILPKAETAMVFFWGETKAAIQYDFIHSTAKQYRFDTRSAWIGGLHNEPIMTNLSGKTQCVFVECTLLGLRYLLHDKASLILNHGFSFDDLQCRQSFDGLGDQLHDTRDGRLASALVQSYLLKYYSQQELPFLLKDMSPVANHIVKQKGMVQVKQLENKFRVSGRWLEKQFNEQIGCSPKEYARITRFNALLFDLQKHPLNAFFSLMEDYGYYDQSHLIKDFRAFTGQTPGQYLAERHPDDAHVVYKWLG